MLHTPHSSLGRRPTPRFAHFDSEGADSVFLKLLADIKSTLDATRYSEKDVRPDDRKCR